jgi:hypothetical protein
MSAPLLARAMLTALAAGQGLAPLFIDLNRTHATNPLWTGHARFHLVWQTFSSTLLNALAVFLVWFHGPTSSLRFDLAALLTAIPMISFLIAMFAQSLYGGALHDSNGIRPLPVHMGNKLFEVDMNAAVVLVAIAVLGCAVMIF